MTFVEAAVLYLSAGVLVAMTLTPKMRRDMNEIAEHKPAWLALVFVMICALWPIAVYDEITGAA